MTQGAIGTGTIFVDLSAMCKFFRAVLQNNGCEVQIVLRLNAQNSLIAIAKWECKKLAEVDLGESVCIGLTSLVSTKFLLNRGLPLNFN